MNLPGLAFALLGLIWGSNFIFMHWASAWITPLQIVQLRVFSGFIPLLIMGIWQRVFHREHWRYAPHFVVMALLATVLYYWAYAAGTARLLSSVSGVISGCIPLFSFLVAAIFLRHEAVTQRKLLGVALGLAGVLMIARPWQAMAIDQHGVWLMIAGSLCIGVSFVYAKKFLSDLGIPALALVNYQMGAALIILLLLGNFDGMTNITASSKAVFGLVVGLGILGTGVAYFIYYYLVRSLGAVTASSVTYIPPVVALLIGYFFAGEPIGSVEIVSTLLIFLGVWLLQSGRKTTAP